MSDPADVLAGTRQWHVEQADVMDGLARLPAESVHCVVTSVPYYGLRDYGTGTWEGGDPECAHKVRPPGSGMQSSTINGAKTAQGHQLEGFKGSCGRCGAVRVDKQIGLEPTLDNYLERMVAVFREVRRVMRKDGTCWINIGDSYAGSWGAQSRPDSVRYCGCRRRVVCPECGGNPPDERGPGGWHCETCHSEGYLLSADPDCPVCKGVGVLDKTNSSTLGGGSMLSARQIEAHPKGQTKTGSMERFPGVKPKDLLGVPWRLAFALQADGWYLRSAITWCKKAAMPESVTDRPTSATEMVFLLTKAPRYWYDADAVREPHSEATTDTGQRRRMIAEGKFSTEDEFAPRATGSKGGVGERMFKLNGGGANLRNFWLLGPEPYAEAHFATFPTEIPRRAILAGCPPGGVVLDPFVGSGTTVMVALRHGRRGIGLELNPGYCRLARDRIVMDAPMFNGYQEAGG